MLTFALLVALALLLVVAVKYILLRREVGRIAGMIRRIHQEETGERLTVEIRRKEIVELANAVNALYEEIYRERGQHRCSMDEMKSSMAGISHDLRTPLTSIIGYVNLLQDKENTPEQNERFLGVVSSKAKQLNQMISSLFELTRLESGAYSFDLEKIEVGEILAEVLAEFYSDLMDSDASPQIQLWEAPLWMIGDRNAVARIFGNLFQNIIQHGAGAVGIESRKRESLVEVVFSNRVGGFLQVEADTLFLPFHTADPMRTRENAGLGLAIVKELTEQMGGTIAVDLTDDRVAFTLNWEAVASE